MRIPESYASHLEALVSRAVPALRSQGDWQLTSMTPLPLPRGTWSCRETEMRATRVVAPTSGGPCVLDPHASGDVRCHLVYCVARLAYATRRDRIEFTLPLEDEVREVLERMVASLGQILEPFVTRHGRLVDLSCMISDPDCEYQPLHSDTSLERVKFTCFVALQDVTVEMGPTYLCPGTQNYEHHSALDAMQKMQLTHDDMLERLGGVPVLCQTGDAYVMNSQLLHCGGAQASAVAGGKRRRLLYVTWHLPGITPGEHSLRDELVGRFRLGDFDKRGPAHAALPEDFDEEYSELFIAANKLDDAEAMLQFAKCLRERGDLGAVAWMRRACRRGHPLACMHLAEVFCLGELGMAQDLKKAEELRTYAMALCEKLKRRGTGEEPELPLCLKCR